MRQIGLCHVATEERLPKTEIAKRVGAPPFVVDKLMAQARRYGPDAVAAALARLHETDCGLKGMEPWSVSKILGRDLGERILLERLIADLCKLGGG